MVSMVMPQLIVVEDQGPRLQHIREALKGFAEIKHKVTLHGLCNEEAEKVAEYDAVLVDFDLQTEKNRHRTPAPTLVLNLGHAGEVRLEATTGIGAMLHLRNVFASKNYQEAREKRLREVGERLPPGWRPPPPHVAKLLEEPFTPRLFAFVHASDEVSRLFASACADWFGADYLDAQGEKSYLRAALGEPDRHEQAAQSRRIQRAGAALTRMLEEDFLGKASWLAPRPDAFQWLRIYYTSNGKRASERVLQDAIEEVLPRPLMQYNLRQKVTQYEPIGARIQAAVRNYMQEWDRGLPDWPEWGGPRSEFPHEDPVYEWLQRTDSFWSAADVHAAWHDFRRRLSSTS